MPGAPNFAHCYFRKTLTRAGGRLTQIIFYTDFEDLVTMI